jgi:hypothetical protein
MKKMRIGFMLATLAALACFAQTWGQTNFYEQVSSMWYSGNKTGVLSIAEQRLQQNTNDIAGLILKMEYELEFLNFEAMTNTMQRVVAVGGGVSTTNFVVEFPSLQGSINHLLNMIPLYPVNEIAVDREKGKISGKPLDFGDAIKALQDDGYFQ